MKRGLVAIVLALLALAPAVGSASQGLRVGSDISYAPLEFYAPNSKRVQGFDYDLAQALAAKMGTSASFQNHDFNSLIGALIDAVHEFSRR